MIDRIWLHGLLILTIFMLLLLMFLYARPVGAQEHPAADMALVSSASAQTCAPLAVVLDSIGHQMPVVSHVVLDKGQTSRVLAWYNKQPPESDDHFNFIVLVQHPERQIAILFGNDGTVCQGGLVPPPAAPELMRAIAGDSA